MKYMHAVNKTIFVRSHITDRKYFICFKRKYFICTKRKYFICTQILPNYSYQRNCTGQKYYLPPFCITTHHKEFIDLSVCTMYNQNI